MMKTTNLENHNQSKGERGQSLVELALGLTIILSLLAGAVDFGMGLFAYVSMRDAAQEGALYGSINPADEAGIKLRVMAATSDIVTLTEGDISVTYSTDDHKCEGLTDGSPNTLTVTIAHPHQLTTPLLGTFLGSQTINLTARVTDTILSPMCP